MTTTAEEGTQRCSSCKVLKPCSLFKLKSPNERAKTCHRCSKRKIENYVHTHPKPDTYLLNSLDDLHVNKVTDLNNAYLLLKADFLSDDTIQYITSDTSPDASTKHPSIEETNTTKTPANPSTQIPNQSSAVSVVKEKNYQLNRPLIRSLVRKHIIDKIIQATAYRWVAGTIRFGGTTRASFSLICSQDSAQKRTKPCTGERKRAFYRRIPLHQCASSCLINVNILNKEITIKYTHLKHEPPVKKPLSIIKQIS